MTRLESEIREFLGSENVMLMELHSRSHGGSTSLRIIADRKVGSITIDDCAHLTRQIQFLIAEKNLLGENYTLEVSSPGLDYPLRDLWQFEKNIGRLIKVRVPGEKGPREISGRLTQISDTEFTLSGGKTDYHPKFAECLSAVVLPEFKSTVQSPAERSNGKAKESQG